MSKEHMDTDFVTIHAHFDGEQIRLDEPYKFELNAKLLITVLPKDRTNTDREEWLAVSSMGLAQAYGNDEPEYTLGMIREANPEYERR